MHEVRGMEGFDVVDAKPEKKKNDLYTVADRSMLICAGECKNRRLQVADFLTGKVGKLFLLRQLKK